MIRIGDKVPIPYNDGEWEVVDIIYYLPATVEVVGNDVPTLRPVQLQEAREPMIEGSNVFVYVKGKGTPFSYKEIEALKG